MYTYIYVHTESYGHASPSLKTHGMGGCCVFFKIEHGNNSLSQISQCSKIEAMSLRVRRKTRTLGKHSKLMLTRVEWLTQVALKLRLPRSVLIKVWNYMLRCCPGFMQSFVFSGPLYSGRLANCISNSFSKNGCPPSAINQYSPWNYSYQLAGTLALTRKVIFPNGSWGWRPGHQLWQRHLAAFCCREEWGWAAASTNFLHDITSSQALSQENPTMPPEHSQHLYILTW